MLPDAAAAHYLEQQQIDAATAAAIARLWRRMGPDFDSTWARIRPGVVALVKAGQLAAARTSIAYISSVLAEQGEGDGDPAGTLDPTVFASTTPDGRTVEGLVDQAPTIAKARVASGLEPVAALASAGQWLTMATLSTVADTSREVVAADIGQRTAVQGYVRMLNPPSCSRCVVLSGKFFRYNEGFQRHPRCLPAGVPVSIPGLEAATRRWYEGELVVIRTASGNELPITGNHPVLTSHGWIPARLLKEGDHVIRSLTGIVSPTIGADVSSPHQYQVPTLVEDVWHSNSLLGVATVEGSTEDFHGDGLSSKVNVVTPDGFLSSRHDSACDQPGLELSVSVGNKSVLDVSGGVSFNAFGAATNLRIVADQPFQAGAKTSVAFGPLSRFTDSLASSGALLDAFPPVGQRCGLVAPAHPDSGFPKSAVDGGPCRAVAVTEFSRAVSGLVEAHDLVHRQVLPLQRWDAPSDAFSVESRGDYARLGLDLLQRLAGQVELDRVVFAERRHWSGHVYNLNSSEGWYSAAGLIVSNCDCRHIPASEQTANDYRTDPYEYFRSLSTEQQDATFGRIEARSIRDGADIYRVVNTQQRGLSSPGSRQAVKFGTPTRKTIDEIYRTAGTRTNAIRMMRDEGYITGAQTAGGNILGRREGFGQLGKGGRARAASDAVTAARATGVRDPLNRYTMTAAERRLYDAHYKLQAALTQGVVVPSVGRNSADTNTRPLAATPARVAILRAEYERQLRAARSGPASVKRLASALGITL